MIVKAQSTYYVDDDAIDDSGIGSIGDPFKTITHSITHMVGGDTLYVRAGIYNEFCKPYGKDGTAVNHTIVKNYTGESPIIDGTGLTFADGTYLVVLYDYMDISGFEIQNANIDGLNGVGGGGAVVIGEYSTLSYCVIHDTWQLGAGLMADNSVIEYCEVYNAASSNSDGIRQTGETWSAGMTARISSSIILNYPIMRHNEIHDNWGEGLSFAFCNYALCEDNEIYDNYSVNLYTRNSQNGIIQRNLVYMTEVKGDYSSVGIGHWNEGTNAYKNVNNAIINNIVYGCERNFYGYNDLVGILVANNTFVNSTEYYCIHIGTGDHTGGTVVNNIIIQEDVLPCIYFVEDVDVTFLSNLYNKAYDVDAVGVGDVTNDPHFTNPATHDYTLTAISHAIDVGTDVGINTDYGENLRDVSPDIGAYEYDPPESPPAVLPSIITNSMIYIWPRGATSSGNVINDGDGTISARGICWATSADPDLADNVVTVAGTTGIFTATITGLTKNTTYHVRAYCTNEIGTAYGMDLEFTTPKYSYAFNNGRVLFINGKIGVID